MTMMTTTTTSSFTLPERSKEFSTTLFHDLQNLDPHREIVGIEAPTGVGKTTLLVNMFRERSRTLMIMPTQFACQQWLVQKKPTDKMMIMNASKAVDYFIRHQGLHHLRTIILDEAHVDSREYYAIRKIMRMAKRRHHHKYYFVSATLPIAYLQQSFPELHVLSYQDFRPYKINIHYEPPNPCTGFHVDRRAMIDVATKRLTTLHPSVQRVLIFAPTHEECDDMERRIESIRKKQPEVLSPTSVMGSCPILVLHGGLEPEEKEEVKQRLRVLPSYIAIATNIAESSITIPDLDVVIDSGLECRVQNSNYTVIQRASKMSLIQRAGRTGRTKDGTVYRLMPEEIFNGLNEFSTEAHDMDPIALRCLLHGSDAVRMFGPNMCGNLLFLDSLNIGTHTSKDKLVFLEACGLRTIAGSLLWNLTRLSHKMSRQETMWIALLILVIEQYDKKPVNWVYYPHSRDKSGRMARMDPAIQRLQRFSEDVRYEGDMLVTIARFLLSILCYGKAWRDAASSISLNQKNVREFVSDWKRVFRHLRPLFPAYAKSDLGPVEILLSTLGIEKKIIPTPLPQKKQALQPQQKIAVRVDAVDLDRSMIHRGRQFFIGQPILYGPKLMHRFYTAPVEYEWPENKVTEWGDEYEDGGVDADEDYFLSESRYFDDVYHNQTWSLHYGVDRSPGFDSRIRHRPPKAIHPIRMRGTSYGSLLLWTNVPEDRDAFHHHIIYGIVRWQKHQTVKASVRVEKKAVLEEIRDFVALMPPSDNEEIDPECRFSGGWLWKQAEEDFRTRVQSFQH